jgi:hypothetical protein
VTPSHGSSRLSLCAADLAGILAPSITGFMIQYGAGYSSAFVLASAMAAAGMLALWFSVRGQNVERLRRAPV